jgi:putative addiction module component (TIGR02574 family)
MAQMSPQASEWLEKALRLSERERELLVDGLVGSLANEPAEKEIEGAWSEEVRRRAEEIRTRRVKAIPGEQLLGRLKARQRDERR